MPIIKTKGKFSHIARSWISLMWIGTKVSIRHLFGKRLVDSWTRDMEVGNLFWRGQFNHAFNLKDFKEGRKYFDSLQTYAYEVTTVTTSANTQGTPRGVWHQPDQKNKKTTILYLHGGGYSFNAAISKHFTRMLSDFFGMQVFEPDYRMTPENQHPAQLEDALEAYRYLLKKGIAAENLVVMGDSAGGHLALMLMIKLKEANLPQPALVVGLCPWTDFENSGGSAINNDQYDLVQSHMLDKFAKWLKGDGNFSTKDLSPILNNFKGLAPIYLQGGDKEILIDMIRNFSKVVKEQGAEIMLDVWPDMTHDFQANGTALEASHDALKRVAQMIETQTNNTGAKPVFPPCKFTKISNL